MSAGPSRGDLLEDNTGAMRLVIDLDLGLLPSDPGAELRRTLGFWTAWLPKMDLTHPPEQELHDSNQQVVGMLRLIEANATDKPVGADERRFDVRQGLGGSDGTDDLA